MQPGDWRGSNLPTTQTGLADFLGRRSLQVVGNPFHSSSPRLRNAQQAALAENRANPADHCAVALFRERGLRLCWCDSVHCATATAKSRRRRAPIAGFSYRRQAGSERPRRAWSSRASLLTRNEGARAAGDGACRYCGSVKALRDCTSHVRAFGERRLLRCWRDRHRRRVHAEERY